MPIINQWKAKSLYTPQDSCGKYTSLFYKTGDKLTIDVGIDYGITSNIYQWYKGSQKLTVQTNRQLKINALQLSDAGNYYCEIKNTIATDLTLNRRLIKINVTCANKTAAIKQSICQGDSLKFNNKIFKKAGIFQETSKTKEGCDSVTTLTISLLPKKITAQSKTLCQNNTFSWQGKILTAAGIYYDTLKTSTGCDSILQLALAIENPSFLAKANAGNDQTLCANTTTLLGNSNNGLIGQWTALDGGTILAKNNAKTELSNLSKGEYRFVWSLSSTTCAAYSSDTVRIEIKDGKTPNALDDGAYYLTKDTVNVNVLDNDKDVEIGKILLRLLPSSQGGSKASLQNPSGIFKFVAPVTAKGDFIFRYALCNTDCPDRCDTANITLKQRAIFEGETVLTPNDDGFNDELIVDDIQKFPKNEIYIYNRWGDVVFHQKPYSNDWRGVNRKGQTLSQGSYYYVLFLDIADGEIRTGDILLIR